MAPMQAIRRAVNAYTGERIVRSGKTYRVSGMVFTKLSPTRIRVEYAGRMTEGNIEDLPRLVEEVRRPAEINDPVYNTAEFLVEALADRGAAYHVDWQPPQAILRSPTHPTAELYAEGKELVLVVGDFRHSSRKFSVCDLAALIVPLPGKPPDMERGLELAELRFWLSKNEYLFHYARKIAAGEFPGDEVAISVAQIAAGTAARAFEEWCCPKAIVAAFVRNALKNHRKALKSRPRLCSSFHGAPDVQWRKNKKGEWKKVKTQFPKDKFFGDAFGTQSARTPPYMLQKDRAATKKYIEELLDALPPADAEIVRRRYLDGERTADIAKSLSISERTVQRTIQGATAYLAEEFQKNNVVVADSGK